ncbi:hypothetical protein TNCV_3285771 [Trichonephila clavipes]|nr:hypothetical protein TNCV_3285771 [Trichonephila clavipes]
MKTVPEDREVHEELRHLTSRPDRSIPHTEANSHLRAPTIVEKKAEKDSCTTFKGFTPMSNWMISCISLPSYRLLKR